MRINLGKIKLASFLLFCFLFSGCALQEKARQADQKLGEIFQIFQSKQVDKTIKVLDEKKINPDNITDEEKKKIDEWMEANGLNRYGDPIDTIYMGGTPLFDESTGETKERFQYIFENHPDIFEKIN